MCSQALLVVLAPTIPSIATDLGSGVGTIGQARSVTAAVAIGVSIVLVGSPRAAGVSRLLAVGSAVGLASCGAVAASPTAAVFLAAHALVGVAFALLLTAGFTGVAAFPEGRRAWAVGYVSAANGLAWIVVNPIAGAVTDLLSWRVAQVIPAVIALVTLVSASAAASALRIGPTPGLRDMFLHASARHWMLSELIAFAAWTGLLTFVGAYFIQILDMREAVAGWLLAAGAAAYFAAATRSGRIIALIPRRRLISVASLSMGALAVIQLNSVEPIAVPVLLFCLTGVAAGLRTPASSGLGLEQLPDQPGAMMAARTAMTQIGYLIGGVVGGLLIAGPGFPALGFAIGVGMALSALLILGVEEPS